jgi:hypothetical protein
MSTPPAKDIDAWVHGLAAPQEGGEPPDPEAEALRQAVLAYASSSEQAVPATAADEDAAWQRMRFRLRRERLIVRGGATWRTWMPATAVATVLMALVVPALMRDDADDFPYATTEAPGLRGSAAQEFAVPDPLTSARKAAMIISRQDKTVSVYLHEGTATVDFEIGLSAGADLQEELKRAFPQAAIQPGFNRWVFRKHR